MTVSLKHSFTTLIADDPADAVAGKVLPSHWNAEHTLTGAANTVLGFTGVGALTEITNLTSDGTNVTGLRFKSTTSLDWDNGSGTVDLSLLRDTSNILAQRNGTNAQEMRIYNTSSSSNANYERGYVGWVSDGFIFGIGTQAGGTGSARDIEIVPGTGKRLYLGSNAAARWYLDGTTGALTPNANASYDIGSAAVSVRTAYFAAGTTSFAPLVLAAGVAPTSPVNGAIWSDGSDLFMRLGGVTYKFTKT